MDTKLGLCKHDLLTLAWGLGYGWTLVPGSNKPAVLGQRAEICSSVLLNGPLWGRSDAPSTSCNALNGNQIATVKILKNPIHARGRGLFLDVSR